MGRWWVRGVTERNNGFLEPLASSHLIQFTSYGKKSNGGEIWDHINRGEVLSQAAKGKLEC